MARKSLRQVKQEQQDSDDTEDQTNQVDDSQVMRGGPGDDQEVVDDLGDKTKTSDLVDYEINGQKYKVDKNTAAILAAQQQGFDRTLNTLKQQQTQQQPTKDKKKSVEEDEDDLTVRLFSDPKSVLEELKKNIISTVRTEMTSEYTQDQSQRQFWNDFYEENKDLNRKTDHGIVEMVLRKNLKGLADMQTSDAGKKLADLAREEILSIIGRHNKNGKSGNRAATFEAPSTEVRRSQQKTESAEDSEEEKRPSLSQLIKKRRDAKRRAQAL